MLDRSLASLGFSYHFYYMCQKGIFTHLFGSELKCAFLIDGSGKNPAVLCFF